MVKKSSGNASDSPKESVTLLEAGTARWARQEPGDARGLPESRPAGRGRLPPLATATRLGERGFGWMLLGEGLGDVDSSREPDIVKLLSILDEASERIGAGRVATEA